VPLANQCGEIAGATQVVSSSNLLNGHAANRRGKEYTVYQVQWVAQIRVHARTDWKAACEHRGATGRANWS